LTAHLRSGAAVQIVVDEPAPVAEEDLLAKFLDCCAFAGIDRDDAASLAQRLLATADEADADALVHAISRIGAGAPVA
jgi:hypothetical protein